MNTRNSDPLKRLPYEIWTRTMKFYAQDQPEGPLPLLAVSASWEKCLLASPEVWTTIYLDGGHDEHARAACFFHLSGTFKINLVLDRNSGAIDIFIEHRDRVKSLVFMSGLKTPYSSDDVTRFSYWLSKYTYTHLLHIHVEPPRDKTVLIPRNLIESCPALIGVHGGFIDQDNIPYLSASTTSLGISGDGILSDGIGDQLKVVRVRLNRLPLKGIAHPKYFTVPTTQMEEIELSSGIWDEYEHERDIIGIRYLHPIMAFVSTTHYGLHVLRVAVMWYDVNLILSHLSACPTLRELELILDIRPDRGPSPSPSEIGTICHIRKLTISVPPEISSQFSYHEQLGGVIRFLIKMDGGLRELEELRCNFVSPTPGVIEILRSARKLKTLHLAGSLPAMHHLSERISLNHLHTLFLRDLEDLEWFETPNLLRVDCRDTILFKYPHRTFFFGALKSLTIPCNSIYRWDQSLLEENDDLEAFPSLLTLQLTYGRPESTLYSPLHFSNLTSISFVDLAHFGQFGRTALDWFMLDLLLWPYLCPRLHTIRAGKYPNWALAAATFHRRNSFPNVTSIDSLWLHAYPEINILRLITRAIAVVDEDAQVVISAAVKIDQLVGERLARHYLHL